ncbi:hypothetical protein L3Q82_001031 [Scortum barcoo]|uniref:Uncharacterized protein n=1 Tax=Scortum barcoo TaxID=214431 RepID=A0ACB8WAC6_9TELE|nr:hypothetical protein L3Q82_001031 [Scortum barcoo]
MDPTEDLSARVLLKHILSTETPRTPITRSASKAQSTSVTRRSSRLGQKDAGAQTPQNILRRSLKHKLRESITRKSLPAPKSRASSLVLRKMTTPAPASMLFDDGDTPRHILMNILRTEPARSPVVHEEAASEEPQPSSSNSSTASKRPSIELSGLDLPDITIGHVVSTAKGLSRKRPRRSLNVTAFEKRLKDGNEAEEENEKSVDDLSSLSLSSSTSLTLKTPFVDVHTERRGLQRRVSNRRKITEEEFGAAVNKRQMGGASSFVLANQGLSVTAHSEGFTLGLSKLSEPDITTDIVHCNTALYAQSDANLSIVGTQDKPTVMASQLQRQMSEVEQSQLGKEKSMYVFDTEEGVAAEPQNEERSSQSEEDVDAPESQKEDGQLEDASAMSKSDEEEPESQTGLKDDESAESEGEENRVETEDGSQATEEEEGGVDSQPEEDIVTHSQSEEEEVAPDSQSEEEKEEGEIVSQPEEDIAAESKSEEEEDVAENQSDLEDLVEGSLADFKPEDEHNGEQASEQLERDMEHISGRAYRSEGGLILPVTEAGGDFADTTAGFPDGKSKMHSAVDLHSSLDAGSQGRSEAEPDADKENSFHLPEVTIDTEDNRHLRDNSPEEAAAQDSPEEEEEWEDDENGEENEGPQQDSSICQREKEDVSLRSSSLTFCS